ncbi:hypothetical protein RIF29_39882 [Crotalaria pallida]|uniref:Uncharacterized protein n=1 Tax=Crotalaria pallida TaxID=3830 RepID=A0AAN9E4I2_CROPI
MQITTELLDLQSQAKAQNNEIDEIYATLQAVLKHLGMPPMPIVPDCTSTVCTSENSVHPYEEGWGESDNHVPSTL